MTHSAHRVKLWWKSSRIFSRISLPLSGDGNHWPLVSHDPSESCNTSWRMTAGMSRPVSLFSPGLPWWIQTATSRHPLMKAERFCWKKNTLFHHNLTLCSECVIRISIIDIHRHLEVTIIVNTSPGFLRVSCVNLVCWCSMFLFVIYVQLSWLWYVVIFL